MLERGVALATPQVGDLVVVPVTGAYCYSLSNNYNGARRPPVVICRDGDARLAVRRETMDDLLARAYVLVTPHPLDPLSADEIRQAAGILRRDHGVGERWRFASIELREPPKAVAARSPATRARERRLLEPRRRRGLQGARRRSATIASSSWEHQPDGQPNMTVDECHECDEALRARPARDRGARRARHHRHGPRC